MSRTVEVDATGGPLLGSLQYRRTLDLRPKEVVFTFDDGPHPRNTKRVLDALHAECVKATFFPLGQWAEARPAILRDIEGRGHTIGSHTWSHANLARLSRPRAERQIEKGMEAVQAAMVNPIAPFFRFPGLNHSKAMLAYASKRDYAVFSCDVVTDDWRGISARTIVRRTMARLKRKGGGILLFHDTRANTAAALPLLLKQLKKDGYTVAHIVPSRPERPQEPTTEVASEAVEPVPVSARVRRPDSDTPPVHH